MNLEIFFNSNLQRISSEERLLNELSRILTDRALRADHFEEDVKRHNREKYEQ
jgi:hypothetical protein